VPVLRRLGDHSPALRILDDVARQLGSDRDNLRAALTFWLDDAPASDGKARINALRLAANLGVYWYHRGLAREGTGWLERALSAANDPPPEVEALALRMLGDEGLPNVFARHQRHGAATREAVRTWGLEVLCVDEREHSGSLTAVLVPEGHDADDVRRQVLDHFDMSLGAGLGKLAGRIFRIGHLGHFNDLTLAGTLSGVQMGLRLAGVPAETDGVAAALALLEKG